MDARTRRTVAQALLRAAAALTAGGSETRDQLAKRLVREGMEEEQQMVDALVDYFLNTYDSLGDGGDPVADITGVTKDRKLAEKLVAKRRALKGADLQKFMKPTPGDKWARALIEAWLTD